MNNQKLIEVFNTIGDLLEIKGEDVFKIRAYRRAAESIGALGREVQDMRKDTKLTEIPGIGKAIAEKIDELLASGKLDYLERLAEEIPLSLVEILRVPDMGPKKVALVWRELGILTVEQLELAAQAGKLRDLPGMGAKSESKILAGIQALKRRSGRVPLGTAYPFAQELLNFLRSQPGVLEAQAAGSLRRMRATVGDLDLLAAAADSQPVMQAFVTRSDVVHIIGHGSTKSSVEFENGLRAQLWVHPPERFGTALQYATGSKDHNVRLRELALAKGYSLSEHALTHTNGTELLCASEAELYTALALPEIPPELREDRGEIQAARTNSLPRLVNRQHILSELHSHSTWSDGRNTMEEMARAAIERGYRLIAITDHSHSLGIVRGVHPEDVVRQHAEIERLRTKFGESISILHGVEVEIKADGSLDYPDAVLESLDIVVASLHTSLRQPRDQVTDRLLNAIRNPHVDIIGHPTGRLLPDREGADLDMEKILQAAAEHGTALEINAHPARLDLEDIYARRAIELGILLSVDTDAHQPSDFDHLFYGIATARRAWAEPHNILNTWQPDQLMTWLKSRRRP